MNKINYQIHGWLAVFLAIFIISFLFPTSSFAAEKKDKAARRAAIMMQKMQQDMQAEKAAMQAQFDAEKKVLTEKVSASEEAFEKLNKEFTSAQHKNKQQQLEIGNLTTEKSALDDKLKQTQLQLETTQKNLADLTATHNQALADLKFNDSQRKALSSNLAKNTQMMNACEAKNAKLHQIGTDLIHLYDNPTTFRAIMRDEQFFQLKRVELENTLQSQQDKLDGEVFKSSQTNP
jgi:DNA repair exonuclease SbcCD ATPase subunit